MDVEKEILRTDKVPKHIAIIMDGNGRWAQSRSLSRAEGHKAGVESVRNILTASVEAGVEYLTLYTFSVENWKRPKEEVDLLMSLMVSAIAKEQGSLIKQGVRVKVIGDTEGLPDELKSCLNELVDLTAENTKITLVLALSYGSRLEILTAARKIATDVKNGTLSMEKIDEALFSSYLWTGTYPDPDLLIRTSGESRLSNFLLWQCAYTEFYFVDKYWPDFDREDLFEAIRNFQKRERRFGKTGEQINKELND